jgi:hypothetical protein
MTKDATIATEKAIQPLRVCQVRRVAGEPCRSGSEAVPWHRQR